MYTFAPEMNDTRRHILLKTFESLRLDGFQGTRADKVVQELGITKGALYHYFPSKTALGYAIVDELIEPRYTQPWLSLASYAGHPIDGIVANIQYLIDRCDDNEARLGCPLNNLIQEMAPLDEGFQHRLEAIISVQQTAIAQAIAQGRQQGVIRADVDPDVIGLFIISALEGSYSVAKALQQKAAFVASAGHLVAYLHSLKSQ